MTNSNPNAPSPHCDELLLSYVEDSLGPEERQIVQEHLRQCPRCSKEVKGLSAIISVLKVTPRAFCPEAWEIYECVRSGASPHRDLSLHLKECPHCLEEFQSYQPARAEEPMPAELLAQVKARLEASPVAEPVEAEKKISLALWEWILENFRRPALGVAAAAAAILIVVLIYPREAMEPMVGLSAAAWENVPRPKIGVESTRERAAVLLFFKGFRQPLSKSQVDSLYQALEPSIEVSQRFDVIPPAVLTQAIRSGEVDPFDRKKLIEGLDDKLEVARVALVTIEPANRGFDVKCDLMRTSDGLGLKKGIVRGVNEADLASTVRRTVWELMLGSAEK